MGRLIPGLCIVVLACHVVMAEDRDAPKETPAKQQELHVNDIVTVLVNEGFDASLKSDATAGPKAESSALSKLNRQDATLFRIATSVVAIRPNGNLVLEGRSETLDGSEIWTLELTGEVRPQSIGSERTVHSNEIAERRIRFRKKNIVSDEMVRPAGGQQEPVFAAPVPASAKVAVLRQKQDELSKLQQEIRQLRIETRTPQQILIRVQMLEFSLTKLRTMGVELPEASSGYLSGDDLSRILTTVNPGGPQPYTAPNEKGKPNEKAKSNDASKFIDWMSEHNIAKVLSEPTIVVLEGRPAQYHMGGEIPMPAKDISKVIEYQPFGTQLDLLATSIGDDRVRLEIRTRVSSVDEANAFEINGTKCPRLNVREIGTGIESTLGQPTVLTGLVETRIETIRTASGVGEVANRVRGKASTRDVTNLIGLMLVVTPERVEAPEMAQRSADAVLPK